MAQGSAKGGSPKTAASVGTGAAVFKEEVDNELRLRSIKAAGAVTVTQDADEVTIGGGGLAFTEQTADGNLVNNAGHIANKATLLTYTLPATAAIGTRIGIVGKGAGLWKIAQNAGQQIHFGDINTTTGAGGSLAANHRYDSLELVCIVADTEWVVRSGNHGPEGITVV